MVAIIAAISENNAIGYKNKLLYNLPDDLKRFKEITEGSVVIMGRKTYESLPVKPLKNRVNVVITHNRFFNCPGCEIAGNLREALEKYKMEDKIFIIGGESIYREGIEYSSELFITLVHDKTERYDSIFPEIDLKRWDLIEEEYHPKDEKHDKEFSFKHYKLKW